MAGIGWDSTEVIPLLVVFTSVHYSRAFDEQGFE